MGYHDQDGLHHYLTREVGLAQQHRPITYIVLFQLATLR